MAELIVALDFDTRAEAEALVTSLGDSAQFYKIGYQLFYGGDGYALGKALIAAGKKVFFDLKLLDIDNTVEKGVAAIARTGAAMLTVHAYPQCMRAAVRGAAGADLTILGVSVLTSMSDADVAEAGAPFYKTTKYGCCASVSTYTWYNLFTGQKVFTGTNNLVKISVPNTGGDALDRYVTFHSNMAATQSAEMKRLKDVLGVLEYGTNKRVTHRIILHAADSDTFDLGPPEVGVTHQKETRFATNDQDQEVALWAYDGKKGTTSLSDFTVTLKWDDKQITIPFKNDAPMLSEAKVPAKIKLETLTKP